MIHRVFTQTPTPGADLAAFERNAERFFAASLRSLPAPQGANKLLLTSRRGVEGSFTLRQRPRSPEDMELARDAEAAGRAAGMAALAERCQNVWLIEPEPGTPEAATLLLCAIVASAALGPVLPPDAASLYGVRGAMERRERLLG
jgi:hypothetical protein